MSSSTGRPDAVEQLGHVLDVQRDINRTLAALGAAVQALLDGVMIGPDAALINATADAFAGREFTTSELIARCTWQDEPGKILAGQLEGVGVRNLGIRLSKLVGRHTAAGLTLQRVPGVPGPALWRVLGV